MFISRITYLVYIKNILVYIQSDLGSLIVFIFSFTLFIFSLIYIQSHSVSSYLFIFSFMLFIFSLYLFIFRFNLFNHGFTRVVQSWFHAYLIWASKKLFNQALRFHSHSCTAISIDYLLRLLKITRYQEYSS